MNMKKYMKYLGGLSLIGLLCASCKGDYDDWAAHYAQALWLEQWRMRNQAEMLARLLGGDGKQG